MSATDTIKEALREFVGDGDGADEAVLDEYTRQAQAQALRDAKAWIKSSSDLSTLDGDWAMAWNLSTSHALEVLEIRAASLTDTSGGRRSDEL